MPAAKVIDSIDKLVNTEVAFQAVLNDGKKQILKGSERLYETLAGTWFHAELNMHYFAKKDIDDTLLLAIWKTTSKRVKKGAYYIEKLEVKNDTLHFYGLQKGNPKANDVELIFFTKRLKKCVTCPLRADNFADGVFSVTITDFKDEVAEGGYRWDAMLRFRDEDGNVCFYRIEDKRNRHRLRRKNAHQFRFPNKENYKVDHEDRFLGAIPCNAKYCEEDMFVNPNYNVDYQLSLQGLRVTRYYMRFTSEEMTDIALTDDKLTVSIRTKKTGRTIKGLALVLREDDTVRFSFTEIDHWEEKNHDCFKYEMNIKEIDWLPTTYNFVVEEEMDGIIYDIRPKNLTRSFRKKFFDLNWQYSVDMGDYIFFLVSMRNGNIIIRYREKLPFDDVSYRRQEKKARLLYLLGKPILDRMGITLIYERYSTAAQDNGVHMFEYYMKQKKKNVYYVIRTDMPDYKKVEKYGKQVIPFMSLKHMVYIQAAKLLISTDTKRHGYQWLGPNSKIYDKMLKKPAVFLQHGVLAMKVVSSIYDRYRANACDLFITSSPLEKSIVNQYFRYEQRRIAVTGLARWDVLFDKSGECEKREILFIPTWRNWMDGVMKDEFLQSDYYKTYVHLLESKKLHEILEKHDTKMIFCMHHKFKEFAGTFPKVSENIEFYDFGDTPLNQLLMRCSMLVTDYSSVAWDTYYQDKPCIFYQFDYDTYMELQGSYFDMKKELFGDRVTKEDDLLNAVDECLERGCTEKEEYKKLKPEYLPYRDHKHCERIDQAIREMGFKGKTEVL